MINIDGIDFSSKILSLEEISRLANLERDKGKKIGLCTGSFDLLHPGHMVHFESAKKFCDVLLVGVANDKFSSRKDPSGKRPIYGQETRAYMVSNIKSVDYVFIEDGSDLHLRLLKPDFFIKGRDYSNGDNEFLTQQGKMMSEWGGKLVFTSDPNFSTSRLIEYIESLR